MTTATVEAAPSERNQLVESVRAELHMAETAGRPRPGRNALATKFGTSTWKVRQALADIASTPTPLDNQRDPGVALAANAHHLTIVPPEPGDTLAPADATSPTQADDLNPTAEATSPGAGPRPPGGGDLATRRQAWRNWWPLGVAAVLALTATAQLANLTTALAVGAAALAATLATHLTTRLVRTLRGKRPFPASTRPPLVQATPAPSPAPAPAPATARPGATDHQQHPSTRGGGHRPWALLVIGLAASVALWSGWVELGAMTGFGRFEPLPGILDGFQINSAIVLPISLEAYAAFALRVWLTAGYSARTTRFACVSAIASLVIGAGAQAAYHLMKAAGMTVAPWWITVLVACVPVAVLGLASALAKLVASDRHPGPTTGDEPASP